MNAGDQVHWYHRFSLRSRMIMATAVVVAAVVGIGGVLILLAIRSELVETADEVGKVHATAIARRAAAGSLPRPLPLVYDPELAVQVVGGGRVLTSTVNVNATETFALPRKPPGATEVLEVDRLPVSEGGPYRVTVLGTDTPQGPATIYVAISIEDTEDILATATALGGVGLLLLVVVLCGVMWVVIGRTLAPVERIRRQADEIGEHRLDRRVLEPIQRDEIGRLARTVNAMLGRLQDSADRQHRFVADAAHELRSPVASLRAQLETAHDGRDRAEDGLSRADLLQETLRMQTMVDRLLVLARSDAGELAPRQEVVDLDDAVDDVVSSLPDTGVDIELSQVDPVQVSGDPDLLEQMVRNLVQNAIRHASRRVQISLGTGRGQAELTVDDDGPGVPVDRREEVFERFTRLDVARDRDGGGVGLGLAIVAEIVRAHGGSIEVDTAPIGGARFRVRLPPATE